MWIKQQQLELDMKELTGAKLGKEYVKAIYCHHAYLYAKYIIKNEMPSWMNHKLE